MPLLDLDDIVRMLKDPPVQCMVCGAQTSKNYCRECDEFYQAGHNRECPQHSEHATHRIYPTWPMTPFASQPSEWAIYLDVWRQKHIWIEHAAIHAMFGEEFGCPHYTETFMDMGDRALAWIEKATYTHADGKIYQMHFAGSQVDLRIGILGGQFMLFIPRPEFEQLNGIPNHR